MRRPIALLGVVIIYFSAVAISFSPAGEANNEKGRTPGITQTASQTADFETQPLSFQRPNAAGKQGQRSSSPITFSFLFSVVFYLALGGLALWGVLRLAKRHLPGQGNWFSHPAMEVLGRTHLDPRRYVALLRVGKRVLVVGVSPDEINPLSEISDESEVTDILDVARPKTDSGLNLFQKLFQRHAIDAVQNDDKALAEAKAEAIRTKLSSLREHVQSRQLEEADPVSYRE